MKSLPARGENEHGGGSAQVAETSRTSNVYHCKPPPEIMPRTPMYLRPVHSLPNYRQ